MIKQISYSQIPFIDNIECRKLGVVFSDKYEYLGYFIGNSI